MPSDGEEDRKELEIGNNSENESDRNRAFFNSTMFSKCSIECLIDWYIQKFYLNHIIPQHASVAYKLEILNLEELLGVSFNLFNEIIFLPRNMAVHKYELVEKNDAIKAYQLANLTLKNCMHNLNPSKISFFYGDIGIAEDSEVDKYIKATSASKDYKRYYIENLGTKGSCSFYVSQKKDQINLVVAKMISEKDSEVIYCPLKNIKVQNVLKIFLHLEGVNPSEMKLQHHLKKFIKEILDGKYSA